MNSSIDFARYIEEFGRKIKSAAFMTPIFEAVSNSIFAIQERGDSRDGLIVVELVPDESGLIVAYKITDDGVGFTDDNFASFTRLHSSRKRNYGGKGVGHASWLVCFESAEIESVFRGSDGSFYRRRVSFLLRDVDDVSSSEPTLDSGASRSWSTVTLNVPRKRFAQLSTQTASSVAAEIFGCFFLEITRGSKIVVKDAERAIDLSRWKALARVDSRELKEETFSITTARLRKSQAVDRHQARFCAHGRAVESVDFEELSGVPSSAPFVDAVGEYFVAAFVQSDYLDRNVDQARASFEFPEGLLDDGSKPTRDEIRALFSNAIRAAFPKEIEDAEARKRGVVDEFLRENPQYRALVKFAAPELARLKVGATSRDVDGAFYLARARLEAKQRQAWDAFKKVDAGGYSREEIKEKFRECLELVETSKQADLAAYVLKRKVVIEILEYLLSRTEGGAYQKERAIHELIYPMRTTSNDEESFANNIWLIDDKLIPYDFIASDVPILSLPGVASESLDRPDLLAFDNPMAFAVGKRESELSEVSSLVVVDFKRPMRDDYKEQSDPIGQVLRYVRKLRAGYKSAQGRPVKLAENARVSCYVVADLTDSLKEQCYALRPTQDGQGFFNMLPQDGTYIEVVSYDKLLNDAKKRNAEFFRRLGLSGDVFIRR